MNKKFILIATLSLSFSFFGCKSNEASKEVEAAPQEKVETVQKIEETSTTDAAGNVETEVKEEVKETKKTVKKTQTAAEKKAAEIKKAEENIVKNGPRTTKDVEIKVDEEKLKKEMELKKAEEDLLKKGPRGGSKGM